MPSIWLKFRENPSVRMLRYGIFGEFEKEEINASKIYSQVGKFAEGVKQV